MFAKGRGTRQHGGGSSSRLESKTQVLRQVSRGADLLTMQAIDVGRVESATQARWVRRG
jgi:hypothetical protein